MLFKYKLLFFLALLAITHQQETLNLTSDTNTHPLTYILWAILLGAISFFILYDRRQNYLYINFIRVFLTSKWNALILKIRQLKET